jgi:hypothetical protein
MFNDDIREKWCIFFETEETWIQFPVAIVTWGHTDRYISSEYKANLQVVW